MNPKARRGARFDQTMKSWEQALCVNNALPPPPPPSIAKLTWRRVCLCLVFGDERI